MTAETTAAPATGDTTASTTTTTDAATGSTTPPGSGDAPQTTTTTDTTTTDKPGDGDKPKEGDDPDKGGNVPEAYELTMPDGMELDSALLEKATPVFKELKLDNEQASKLAALYADHIKSLGEGSAEQAEQWRTERNALELAEQQTADMEALKADKEIGGANFEPIKKQVMDFVGTLPTEFRQMVDKKGLGNNPEFVRALYRAIQYTPQDMGERPAGGGGSRSTASVLFDHPTSQPK